MNKATVIVFLLLLLPVGIAATVDTLRDTSEVDDAIIYNYADCTSEVSGEDCRRFNGGRVVNLGIGGVGVGNSRRALLSFPGWDGIVPDSARLDIYCSSENDNVDRRFFVYPLTRQFLEGTEASYGVGDYPEPDSGVTWNHAWLDAGDSDSLNWNSAGGDFTTAIACTTTITTTGQYFSFDHFERILDYFDTSGNGYGIILINENAFPANSAAKVLKSSEAGSLFAPRLILFTASSSIYSRRRQLIQNVIARGR